MITVVTGASRGIGARICDRLECDLDHKVIRVSRNMPLRIRNHWKLNILDYQKSIKFRDNIRYKYGEIDLLVNNAGVFDQNNFIGQNIGEITEILMTNLLGTISFTHAILPILRKTGRIININSVAGLHGIKNQAAYSASKHGLEGFSESLSLEGFNVTSIYPGGVNTSLWNEKNPYDGDVSKLLSTDDVAKTVEFVANLPSYIVMKKIVMFPISEQH